MQLTTFASAIARLRSIYQQIQPGLAEAEVVSPQARVIVEILLGVDTLLWTAEQYVALVNASRELIALLGKDPTPAELRSGVVVLAHHAYPTPPKPRSSAN